MFVKPEPRMLPTTRLLKRQARPEVEPGVRTIISKVGFRVADNPGVDSATSGLSQVDYGAENGAGKRWV